MNELVRYEAARSALAAACRVDEVKSIRDKARAMQVYAQQAKDRVLIEHATEIRMRAEIRAGELLAEMKVRGERAKGGKSNLRPGSHTATPEKEPRLSDIGVSKTQSSRWQKLAALPPKEQEEKIAWAKSKAEAAIESSSRSAAVVDKDPHHFKRKGPISLADRCCMRMRSLAQQAIRASLPGEYAELFAAIRDEIDDLEKWAAKLGGK
jgi:hypothetical protein